MLKALSTIKRRTLAVSLLVALALTAALAAPSAAQTTKAKVDLNTADLKTIAALPGVGETLAQKIIDGRPFKKLDDLSAIKGIGQTKLDGLKGLVKFSKVEAVKDVATKTETQTATKEKTGADKTNATTTEKTKTTTTETAAVQEEKVLINVNKADLKTLQTLPGIGEALAQKIIDGRPYKKLDDLSKVKGLGEAKLKDLKGLIAFEDKVKEKTVKTTVADKVKTTTTETAVDKTLINVNKADLKALQTLPGIGEALAQKIIDGRPFKTMDDLGKVKGLGEAKLKDLKGLVVFEDKVKEKAPKTITTKETATATTKETVKAAVETPGHVDLNTADLKTLETLPGIGPALAQRIIDARPFKTVADLEKVSGIGEAKMKDLKDLVTVGTKSAAAKSSLAPGEKLNINTATAEQLDSLFGIGPVKSQAIVDYRNANGKFAAIEEVMKVKGIKEGEFAKIKDFIKVK